MWKDLLDEQDDIFCLKSRLPMQSNSGSDKVATAHEYSEPRPTLACLASLVEKLEAIVVRPGFGLPNNGRTPSLAYEAPKQLTAMLRGVHSCVTSLSEQPISQSSARAADCAPYDGTIQSSTYEQNYEEDGDICRQINGDKFVVEADSAAKLDLDHVGCNKFNRAGLPVAASERQIIGRLNRSSSFQEAQIEWTVRRKAGGNAQTQIVSQNEAQRKICTIHGACTGRQGRECNAERVSALTDVEKAKRFRRAPDPDSDSGSVAAEVAEEKMPPSALFCTFEDKPKTKRRKEQTVEDSGSMTAAVKNDYACQLAVSVAEYVLTPVETHTSEGRRPRLETAKRTVVPAKNPGPVARDELRLRRGGMMNFFARRDGVSGTEEYIFQIPVATEQRALESPLIIECPGAGNWLGSYAEENQLQSVYKTLYNGMQELCQRFSSFDIFATQIHELRREELNQMLELLKRTDSRLKDIACFADEHQLSDVNAYKEIMQEMVNAMRERQNTLWQVGVKLWNVSQYSEEYWRLLSREPTRACEETDKSNGEDCVVHCWWHSPSKSIDDDDDIFQEYSGTG